MNPALKLALVVLLLIPSLALAEMKIVTVDVNRILNESNISQKEKEQLNKESSAAKKKLDSRRAQLKKVESKIRNGSVKEDSAEADRFRRDAKEFARMAKDLEEDLRRKFVKSNKDSYSKSPKRNRKLCQIQ